jgi:GTPase KRas protein
MLDILDTVPDEWEHNPNRHYRTSHGFIILYSITDRHTFEECYYFYEKILRAKDVDWVPMVLVGTKLDCETERAVSRQEAEQFANEHQMSYFEVSSKEGVGVKDVMMDIVMKIKFGVGYNNEVFQKLEAGEDIMELTKKKGKKCTIC